MCHSLAWGCVRAISRNQDCLLINPVGGDRETDERSQGFKTAVPKIEKSQAKLIDGLSAYQKTHNPTALIKAVKGQSKTLTALEAKLASQPASSANGTKVKATTAADTKGNRDLNADSKLLKLQ